MSRDWYFPYTPEGPDFSMDWDGIVAAFPLVRSLSGCPQNPVYHAEGDVLTHTRLVCEALISLPGWRGLDREARSIVFAAALFHDIGKPTTTVREADGSLSSKGHVRRGVMMAQRLLWEMGVPVAVRMAITNLISQGSLPMWFWDKPNPERSMILASCLSNCEQVALLMEADLLGRWCGDRDALLERITFFREYASELGILHQPWQFPSELSRFVYFQKEAGDPHYDAFDDRRSTVILMSGLPGVGKDTWVQANYPDWPVVSLDGLRRSMGKGSTGDQGAVIQAARELAKGYLRQGRSFVWNATNLSSQLRGPLVQLFVDYGARVEIVYLEVSPEVQYQRNRDREHRVPEGAIDQMVDRLEVPNLTDAHRVRWLVNE